MPTTPSGLQYEDTEVGTGAEAKAGQQRKAMTPAPVAAPVAPSTPVALAADLPLPR